MKNVLICLLTLSLTLACNSTSKTEKVAEQKITTNLPEDIINRIQKKFPNQTEQKEIIELFNNIKKRRLNVGAEQLIRSILIIADEDIEKIREIIDSKFYGDPRDVIMTAMSVPGNKNDHGMNPFEN